MSDFLLQPWEYQGAGFSGAPQATSRLEIGGKKRNFLLKMREGVIWFKEPSRGAIFGTFATFDEALARDSIGLISAWQKEMAAQNFGILLAKRDYFPKTTCRGRILFLLRENGAGWMREHFDETWFDAPTIEAFKSFDIWDAKAAENGLAPLLQPAREQLINRAIDPKIRDWEPRRFIGPHAEKFEAIVRAALRFIVAPSSYRSSIEVRGHSSFAKGEIEGHALEYCLKNPLFALVWRELESTIFAGITWHEGGEDLTAYNRKRSENFHKAGIEKWGENWRGNWAPRRAKLELELAKDAPSAHERMEAAMVLRDWSRGQTWASALEESVRASFS